MIYLGFFPESVRVCAKKQETVSETSERQGAVPALRHKGICAGDEEFLNDWHDLLPFSIKGWRAHLICAWPFYLVPERQHFSTVESV